MVRDLRRNNRALKILVSVSHLGGSGKSKMNSDTQAGNEE